ncbi:MAG: PTS sugar transporter subunit IIB [Elusimicrobia bacterium]|nr:PTS sugar transporter subunit IIB [Elusimicrobiota bacterium]
MGVVLVRIDDRLIHGQVVAGWVKAIKANHIMVVNDKVARDQMQRVLLSMAVPNHLKLSILSLEEAATVLKQGIPEDDRVIILLNSPQDALSLVEKKVPLQSINVGGIHYCEGKKQILKTVCVDMEDIEALYQLERKGIALEGRIVPTDECINIMDSVRMITMGES